MRCRRARLTRCMTVGRAGCRLHCDRVARTLRSLHTGKPTRHAFPSSIEEPIMIANARLAAAVLLALSATGTVSFAAGPHGRAVLTPASEVKWNDVPGFPGVQLAALGGDPGKGA